MIFLLKFLQNRRLCGFGAAICVAAVRNSIVFCTSVSADRSGMAASRFLAAAAACGIFLMSFAAEWCFGSRYFSILAHPV